MAKKTKRSKETMEKLFGEVKKRVAAGEAVHKACEDVGIHFSSYYNYIKREKGEPIRRNKKASKKKAAKRTYKKKESTPQIEFKPLAVSGGNGKTLLIITEDNDLINSIIANFS